METLKFNQGWKLSKQYELLQEVGTGATSVVYKVKAKTGPKMGQLFSLKKMLCDHSDWVGAERNHKLFLVEVDILSRLDHPRVLHLHDAWRDAKTLYIATDLLTGKGVLDRGFVDYTMARCAAFMEDELDIHLQGKGLPTSGSRADRERRLLGVTNTAPPFCDQISSKIVRQMLQALAYIHSQDVSHRDLKLENFMFEDTKSFNVCLIDFGLAFQARDNAMDAMHCGTVFYMAPELLPGTFPKTGLTNREFKMADMWAFGVIVFMLLTGDVPWHNEFKGYTTYEQNKELFDEISSGKFEFPKNKQLGSEAAMDLVSKLLVVDPKKRLTAAKALEHPWVTLQIGDEEVEIKFDADDVPDTTDEAALMQRFYEATDN